MNLFTQSDSHSSGVANSTARWAACDQILVALDKWLTSQHFSFLYPKDAVHYRAVIAQVRQAST